MNLSIILRGILILGFLILIVRIFEVSIIRGEYYSALSKNNRIRRIPIIAPRGNIFDRNRIPLTENHELLRIVRFEEGKAARFVEGNLVQDEEKEIGINLYIRRYPKASTSAHLVGFIGEVDKDEVEQKGCNDNIFHLGDNVGRSGAELTFDCLLRGRDGEELVEVDIKGKKIRVLGKVEPRTGNDVFLSIDSRLQERATTALSGRRGAVVALDPKNGEVLAIVSSPSFDPNLISEKYSEFAKDSELPLFNRAIGGAYPPGSTFKIAAAAAGIEEGVTDENFRFIDVGFIKLGDQEFTNWLFTKRGGTEGEIDIVRAITRSTDTFFYKLGELVGVEKLASWARRFGLGDKTGINLPGETTGVVPTPEWKERATGERWFLGNTYNMSIGQGDVTATPLQVALMTSVVASGGKLCTPHISADPTSQNFQFPISNFQCKEVGLSDKTLELIRRGMVGACSTGGTAWPLFDFKVKNPHETESTPAHQIQLACKTGTAEFGAKDEHGKTKTHAWLTAYAPAFADSRRPEPMASDDASAGEAEIVVTALVEGGGEGSDVAAPIVKEIFEEWFVNK